MITLKEIELIVSNPDLLRDLKQLSQSYTQRFNSEASHLSYKRKLRMIKAKIETAKI